MILPTNNSVDIYQHSNAQMKYLPEKSVKKLLKTMLYSNKPVYLAANTDRRPIGHIQCVKYRNFT